MLHRLQTKQLFKSDMTTLWDFMSSPANLSKITPSYMGFHILSAIENTKMHPGQIIEYYVTPLAGIKLHWVTEITHVANKEYFVDEQRFGPYAFWHHKHILKEGSGGIEMIDDLHYKLPFGVFGKLINHLFVKKKLKEIFDYRYAKLEELFNS
ncbi:MAG: SRPBCC family protein [Bacteroidota bacterium]